MKNCRYYRLAAARQSDLWGLIPSASFSSLDRMLTRGFGRLIATQGNNR